MNYGHIPGIEQPIPRLIQGTTMISGRDEAWEHALLDAVYQAGARMFDTAHTYANGGNERSFGAWVRSRGLRDEILVLGKGAHHNAQRQRVTPEDITSDLHESLDRLGFAEIDLYLLHRDDPSQPVGPIVEVLNEHQRAGKIRAFGGSNWSVARLVEANAYAAEQGLIPFAASSPNFSLADQIEEPWENCVTISGPAHAADRQWYAETHMPLCTWSSLAGGFLTGKYRRENLDSFPADNYADALAKRCYASEANFRRLDRAEQLAQQKGLTIPQIALAFVLSQPLDVYALTAPHSAEEYRANAAAAAIALTPAELAYLDLQD
ncbi:MAG: aldo/keto reductase [Roseiflexaceae bacterium]|nr:aldo/keto reductase [Roseiflexaceae bacterium]